MKRFLTLVYINIAAFSLMFINLYAQMPLHPDLLKRIKDKTIDIKIDPEEIKSLKARGVDQGWSSEKLLKQSPGEGIQRVYGPALSPKGNYKALVILVTFSDKTFQTSPAYFDQILFSGNIGSLNNYYKEISYNTLDIVTLNLPSETGLITAPKAYSYYVNNKKGMGTYPQNAQRMVEDVVRLADPIVDFSKYDNDGDGYVDALFIVHAGPGYEFTGNTADIHSHSWTTLNPITLDGVRISHYTMEPEYFKKNGDMTLGVFAHELGHAAFGLPDLYDTDYTSEGLGDWSLMAGGSWNGVNGNSPAHPDAWSLIQMGFAKPTLLKTFSDISVSPVNDSPVIYELSKNSQASKEYFLMENRQQQGYDSKLPGSGLLIYHVDEGAALNDNDKEWYPGYTNNGHYRVALIQADGSWDLEKNKNGGDSGDPFPGSNGNLCFDYSSIPDSKNYDFSYSNLAVRNINSNGNDINAKFIVNDALIVSNKIINLGDLEINSGSKTVSFSITNNSSNSFSINNFSASDPNFILSNTNLPIVLQPSATQTINFQFTPAVKGTYKDTVKVVSDPVNYMDNMVMTARSYVINPVNKNIIYGSLSPAGNGKIISISPDNATTSDIGTSGFEDIKSLTIQHSSNQLYGLYISGSSSQIIRINASEGDAYTKLSLNLGLYSIAFDNADNLYGITSDGLLYNIDLNSGIYQLVWKTGLNISSITFNPLDNQLWAAAGINSTDKDLVYKLDVINKNINQVGKTGFGIITNSITFDNQGNLYGIKGSVLQLNQLIKINTSTGAGTEIGSTGYKGIRGIAMLSGNATQVKNNKLQNNLTYKLEQNYPNPFNPVTIINYEIPEKTFVSIKVFNLLGQQVSALKNEEQNPGSYSLRFDGHNLPSGLYIYQINTEKFKQTRKMLLIK